MATKKRCSVARLFRVRTKGYQEQCSTYEQAKISFEKIKKKLIRENEPFSIFIDKNVGVGGKDKWEVWEKIAMG